MKVKFNKQKGITLVALIITIIVLLILAAVGITSIVKFDLIEKTKLAVQKYKEKVNEEDLILGGYNKLVDEYFSNTVVEDDSEQDDFEENVDEITFTINGVTYKAIKGWSWDMWLQQSEYERPNIYVHEFTGTLATDGYPIINEEGKLITWSDSLIPNCAYSLDENAPS